MLDFSKWAAMWDAYNRMGEAVSGSPASICQDIGLTLMMVSVFVELVAVAVIGGGGGDPEKSPFFCLTMAIAVIGGVLAFASFVMPSHNDAHVSEPPALSTQIERTWGWPKWAIAKTRATGLPTAQAYPSRALTTATGSASPTPTANAPN